MYLGGQLEGILESLWGTHIFGKLILLTNIFLETNFFTTDFFDSLSNYLTDQLMV